MRRTNAVHIVRPSNMKSKHEQLGRLHVKYATGYTGSRNRSHRCAQFVAKGRARADNGIMIGDTSKPREKTLSCMSCAWIKDHSVGRAGGLPIATEGSIIEKESARLIIRSLFVCVFSVAFQMWPLYFSHPGAKNMSTEPHLSCRRDRALPRTADTVPFQSRCI
jgi:hypothetical protein